MKQSQTKRKKTNTRIDKRGERQASDDDGTSVVIFKVKAFTHLSTAHSKEDSPIVLLDLVVKVVHG